jgi:hypothetical protein
MVIATEAYLESVECQTRLEINSLVAGLLPGNSLLKL